MKIFLAFVNVLPQVNNKFVFLSVRLSAFFSKDPFFQTSNEEQSRWLDFFKKLEKKVDLKFEMFSTHSKYSGNDFPQLCEDKVRIIFVFNFM